MPSVRIATPGLQPLRSVQVDALLDKAGALLATSLDLPTTLERLADVIVPQFADVCAILLTEDLGADPQLMIWREDEGGARASADVTSLFRGWGLRHAARFTSGETRSPVLVERIGADWMLQEFGLAVNGVLPTPRSALALPLELDERCLGTMLLLGLGANRPRYGAEDLKAAKRLAVFAAAAIRNARVWNALTVELAARQQVEETLRESLSTIGMLSSGLGHDMGNVVHALGLRLEALQRVELPAQAASDVRAISGVMDYLRGLTNGLQLLAGDAQAEQAGYAMTHLNHWWNDVHVLFRNVVPHQVQLECDFPPGLPPLRVPPVALTQIVFNLVQQAGQGLVGRAGARIRLQARRLPGVAAVRLRVQDNGPGVNLDEVNAQIGLRSGQARPPRGLGLPVAFALAERAGGEIRVTTSPNRGTVFTVRLALAVPPPSTPLGDPWPASA
jgi:signal transduction histidine kinase